MRIEAYDFGSMTIDGTTYTRDLKIIDDRVRAGWWRVEGHNVVVEDIEDILRARPEILVFGTGHSGLMRVSEAVRRAAADAGIRIVAQPTSEACDTFNRLSHSARVAFAAHLTC